MQRFSTILHALKYATNAEQCDKEGVQSCESLSISLYLCVCVFVLVWAFRWNMSIEFCFDFTAKELCRIPSNKPQDICYLFKYFL